MPRTNVYTLLTICGVSKRIFLCLGVDESSSLIPDVKTTQPAKGIGKEVQASGAVSRSVYREYATSGAGLCFLALGGLIQVLSHGTFVMQQILLAMWYVFMNSFTFFATTLLVRTLVLLNRTPNL